MKKILSAALAFVFMLSVFFAGGSMILAGAASAGSISITAVGLGEDTLYKDNLNRIWLDVVISEDVKINDADMRTSSGTCFPKININGTDFVFSQTTIPSYLASFAQVYTNDRMHILLKRDPGRGASGNASFYPADYPGIPEGRDTVIKFYKDTVLGAYILANDFEVRISAGGSFTFLSNPHSIVVTGGTAVENVYETDGKTVASENASVKIKAEPKAGFRVSEVLVKNVSGAVLTNVKLTGHEDGTYTFIMPAEDVCVEFVYEEAVYILTIGGEELSVSTGRKIGELPDGRYEIDGCEISSESIWIWEENKTAAPLDPPEDIYTVTFMDGDRMISEQYYSLSNKNIKVPEISSASEYYTVEWEDFTLEGGDKVVKAVWTAVEFTAVFKADDEIVSTVTFTIETEKLECPAIPYKEGYTIVGWDISDFPKGDVEIHAIYEKAG